MNYDEVAKKILSDWDNYCFRLLDGDTPAFDIQEAIAAALRRAANEAAWGAYDMLGNGVGPDEWYKKYGPQPQGEPR